MDLRMINISKSFGANLVLDGVDFSVDGGEITALLGENGAGKSTLMNILGGVIPRNGGVIKLDDKEVDFHTPRESLDAGIAFIHQELNLINDLAIYENLFIGREKKRKCGVLDKDSMISQTRTVFERMDIDLDPEAMVRDLDASYKQIVEISRAMLMNAKLVIMDEPTTSLTEPEIERVFALMRTLKKQGVAIIFISHKLKEVLEICDKYTVLRDGHMVSSGYVKDVTHSDLARMMVGHEVRTGKRKEEKKSDDIVMEGRNLSDGRHFSKISFKLHRGEVLGFTGLLGDGRSELFQTLFGAAGPYEGSLIIEGNEVKMKSTMQAVSLGIGYVPRNRKENGIVKDLSILENGSLVTMKLRKKHGAIDWKNVHEDFDRERKALSIKMESEDNLITSLSGGNQQKVVLAKWLSLNPKVLILDNPTQGVDVGAKEEIYTIIEELAYKGVSVIVLSSEAQEIMRVASRCFVLYHGRIMGELKGPEMEEERMMRLATGVEE